MLEIDDNEELIQKAIAGIQNKNYLNMSKNFNRYG